MAEERVELEKLSPLNEESLVRPGYPRANYSLDVYGNGYGAGAENIQPRELWRKIRKRKWLILVIALIVTTIVTIEVFRIKSVYQGVATVEIEKENKTLLRSGDVVIETDESDYGYYVSLNMKTKIRVLKSRPLLEDVAVNLKLDQNPRFLEVTQRKSTWEALRSIGGKFRMQDQNVASNTPVNPPVLLEGKTERSPEESAYLAPFVSVLAENLSAEPLEETRMLVISFKHTDPALAATIANTVAQVFIQRSFQSKTEKFTSASAWLDRSTRELKSKVEQAEQTLANYTREHNIFSTDEKSSLTTTKLSALHDQVTRAETDRIIKQSLYEEAKQGRVAQLPEAFADPKSVELQKKLGELTTSAAKLSVRYGPDNPQVAEVQKQAAAIQKQIDASRKTLEEKLKADYERALRDQESLKSALDQAKAEAVQQNQAAIGYNILKQNVETSKTLYTDFLQKTNQANIQVAEQHPNIRVIEPAQVPVSPIGPHRLRAILIGLFLSLLGGIGLVFFLEYLDNTIKSVEDVGRYVNLPALAVIPAINANAPRLLSLQRESKQRSISGETAISEIHPSRASSSQLAMRDMLFSVAEAYRMLRTSVLLSTAGSPPKTILITSSQPSEGKTTTVINTAISLAQLGASVLIIDCDLRRPIVHKVFRLNPTQGLSTYLSSEVEIESVIQQVRMPNLSLLPCGPIPPNPAELISSEKMKNMLKELGTRYDHILIDSPPLINVTDPVILSTLVDGVILVVHGGKSTRDVVRRARQELATVGAKIFGVVLNNVDLRREGYDNYYRYRYYSNYGQTKDGTSGN